MRKLKSALEQVKMLQVFLSICSYCKKNCKDKGCWDQVEACVGCHKDVDFSQGICPDCKKVHFPDIYKKVNKQVNQRKS